MQFTSEEYYRAAAERMRQAREIHDSGKNYALAVYCGGLAVECILRAYRWRKDSSFEGRHDLDELFKASGLRQVQEERAREKRKTEEEIARSAANILDAMRKIAALWHNNLRFASEDSLRAHLKRIGRLRGIRGDALKKNSADLLLAAELIVEEGARSWTSKRK
jgi:HEPN domain-containing protein